MDQVHCLVKLMSVYFLQFVHNCINTDTLAKFKISLNSSIDPSLNAYNILNKIVLDLVQKLNLTQIANGI